MTLDQIEIWIGVGNLNARERDHEGSRPPPRTIMRACTARIGGMLTARRQHWRAKQLRIGVLPAHAMPRQQSSTESNEHYGLRIEVNSAWCGPKEPLRQRKQCGRTGEGGPTPRTGSAKRGTGQVCSGRSLFSEITRPRPPETL